IRDRGTARFWLSIVAMGFKIGSLAGYEGTAPPTARSHPLAPLRRPGSFKQDTIRRRRRRQNQTGVAAAEAVGGFAGGDRLAGRRLPLLHGLAQRLKLLIGDVVDVHLQV